MVSLSAYIKFDRPSLKFDRVPTAPPQFLEHAIKKRDTHVLRTPQTNASYLTNTGLLQSAIPSDKADVVQVKGFL